MKENRKPGFILYDDYKDNFELLCDKDIKELLFAIFDYHKGLEINHLSPTAKMAFMFIKNDLDRQLQKYEDICKRNRDNGLKGGRPRDKPKKPSGFIKNPKNPDEPRETQKSQQDTNKIQTRHKQENIIYNAYPRKIGKKKALESIQKALTKIEYDKLLKIVTIYSKKTIWMDGQFIPQPATWFNQERWDDDPKEWDNKTVIKQDQQENWNEELKEF